MEEVTKESLHGSLEAFWDHTGEHLCSSSDQALQAGGFRTDTEQDNAGQHHSQVEQEENQELHPGWWWWWGQGWGTASYDVIRLARGEETGNGYFGPSQEAVHRTRSETETQPEEVTQGPSLGWVISGQQPSCARSR